jgi:uncharacterized cupin superfamily protein
MKQPVHVSQIPWETWYPDTDREIRGKALGDVGGAAKIGIGLLELPPGSNTKPGHWHTDEEEHLYVLSGQATLHLGDTRVPLHAGSFVCFPAGQSEPHYIHNSSTEPFSYIMIGERIERDRVIYASEVS